ncbi:MAG: Bro-N domain-containing protein [Defluviitaleaceae bacterium]|nr:Bro-N domain-containing protein [Defluviitaleaceae bacterium]
MSDKNSLKLFEDKKIRAEWDDQVEKWWFSVVDICAVLTDSDYQAARKYWKVLKGRIAAEGSELVTNCYQLKMLAPDGKMRETDVMDAEQILRLIQSIPSKKAEPFKMWLAKVGNERINAAIDPELSIAQAMQDYRRLGYSENWINQRIKSIEVRKALTDEWDKSGVEQGKEYASLTDLMTRTWSGLSIKEYKRHKGLKKENLRDNMTNTELVLNMLAEVAATDISIERKPEGFDESAKVAREGAKAAKVAREQIEKSTGKPAVSKLNAKELGNRRIAESQITIDTVETEEGGGE